MFATLFRAFQVRIFFIRIYMNANIIRQVLEHHIGAFSPVAGNASLLAYSTNSVLIYRPHLNNWLDR
jgi:hypothetical protein